MIKVQNAVATLMVPMVVYEYNDGYDGGNLILFMAVMMILASVILVMVILAMMILAVVILARVILAVVIMVVMILAKMILAMTMMWSSMMAHLFIDLVCPLGPIPPTGR